MQLSHPISLSLSISLTGEEGAQERERERGREGERESEKEGGREIERGRDREGERIVIIFLKGMTVALAPFR
jgi:hypothetical protein